MDVVEGVSAQTHAVLRQAWREGVQPCLVLNKIDRLITELQLEPSEAFQHLRRTLEQVNVVMAALFAADAMAAQDRAAERAEERQRHQSKETLHMDGSSAEGEEIAAGEEVEEERSDDALYFEPERGNVVFASAVDGWGFTVEDFAEFLAEKMGCKAAALRRCLWGDFFLTKEKGKMQVKPGAEAKGKPPMFARFVLQNIWDVYAVSIPDRPTLACHRIPSRLGQPPSVRAAQPTLLTVPCLTTKAAESRDKPMLDKISHALGVKLPPRVTQQGTTRVRVSGRATRTMMRYDKNRPSSSANLSSSSVATAGCPSSSVQSVVASGSGRYEDGLQRSSQPPGLGSTPRYATAVWHAPALLLFCCELNHGDPKTEY